MREPLSTFNSENAGTSSADTPYQSHRLLTGGYRYPKAAAAALIFIVLIEWGLVWHNRYHFMDANYILLEQKRVALTSLPGADDVAILGSSRFYHLKPKPIAALVGKGAQVTNYSWAYCGVEAYEAMLRGLIEAGRKPKLILTDGFPEIFSYPESMLTNTQSEDLLAGFAATAPVGAALRTEVGQKRYDIAWKVLEYAMTPPSTLFRKSLIQCIQELLTNGTRPSFPAHYDRVAAWQQNGWFNFAPPQRIADVRDFDALQKITGPHILRDNVAATRAYERLVHLAHDNGVKIILLPVPNNSVAFEAFTRNGVYKKYDKWLNGLETKYDNFKAPGPRWFCWPNMLGDAGHVNAAGAARHMDLVLELLRQPLKELDR